MTRTPTTASVPEARMERDALGDLPIPADAYYGIHTMRAVRNFPMSGYSPHPALVSALAQVKLACARTNASLGRLDADLAGAIAAACGEVIAGGLRGQFIVDPFQGGAGTSTNMNANEVLANRASELLGGGRGQDSLVHPLHHVNLHQSTNDVYPTAVRVAALVLLGELEEDISALQEALQDAETRMRGVVKVGRTQLMDAVPTTLGMSFGAFADAVARDRWRIFKCRERIKKVNLGGTAIGTGLGAPRDYILRVAEELRTVTGLPVSRAENLVDATQNLDAFVEVSGMLKAFATTLVKICSDLRLLSSGPLTGLGEITLPPLQAGSSIMAGKINPVMPEAATQAALRVMGNDQVLAMAAGLGQLELNHLLPLMAHCLLESLTLLKGAASGLAKRCIRGIEPMPLRCRELVDQSGALASMLVPLLGYDGVEALLARARASGRSVAEEAQAQGIGKAEEIAQLLSPERLHKLGFTPDEFDRMRTP